MSSSFYITAAMFKIPILILSCLLLVRANASEKEVDDMHDHIYTLISEFPDSANILADASLELSKSINYDWGIGNTYFIKGFIAKKQNHLSQAFLYYLQAIEFLESENTKKAIRAKTMNMSNCGVISTD